MLATISGEVTLVEVQKTESGKKNRLVKILQGLGRGDFATYPVTVWDEKLQIKVGDKVELKGVSVGTYVKKDGKTAGLNLTVWGENGK